MSLTFHSWQKHPTPMGKAPYNKFSPNLALVRLAMQLLFGATGGSGYVVRPVRAGTSPSTHGYGAAWDAGIVDPAKRQAAIDWLLANHEMLGVQAVHDYIGSRIWRVGRGWKAVTPSAAEGWGQSWARWLHIETTPDRWGDTRPLAERGVAPAPGGLPAPTIGASNVRSENVRVLQRHLAALGIDVGRDDGLCGPRTVAGIRTLQERLGVAVDGIYGPKTAAADRKKYPTPGKAS